MFPYPGSRMCLSEPGIQVTVNFCFRGTALELTDTLLHPSAAVPAVMATGYLRVDM